ncbi:MAG: hypothetical protein IIC67_02895 [Thaumarchaeota archaeon]|nr:hypothetical protein [Nitrososphaerota archaeon]
MKKELTHQWIHSHEDDTEDIMVFRRSNYQFPPSRGRRKIEFKEDGQFIQNDIASSCGLKETVGRFKETSPNEIKVDFEQTDNKPYLIKLISCDDKVLKIKKESFY